MRLLRCTRTSSFNLLLRASPVEWVAPRESALVLPHWWSSECTLNGWMPNTRCSLPPDRRAAALADGDADALMGLLHPEFHWTSHTGEHFDRARYVQANTGGAAVWHGQQLDDVEVRVVGATAVLWCTVTDDVTTSGGRARFIMPVTQTWVRTPAGWQCLAGHAGPRITTP